MSKVKGGQTGQGNKFGTCGTKVDSIRYYESKYLERVKGFAERLGLTEYFIFCSQMGLRQSGGTEPSRSSLQSQTNVLDKLQPALVCQIQKRNSLHLCLGKFLLFIVKKQKNLKI